MPKSSVKKHENRRTSAWRVSASRKRRHSSSSDDAVATHSQVSKKWKRNASDIQPDLLKDMGVSVLEDDEGESDREPTDDSQDADLENQNTEGECSSLGAADKSSARREPLQNLNSNKTLKTLPPEAPECEADAVAKCDISVVEDSDCEDSEGGSSQSSLKLEKLKPVNCKIKNSQIIYQNEVTVIDKRSSEDKRCEDVRKSKDSKCRDRIADDGEVFFLRRLQHRTVEMTGPDNFTGLPDEVVLDVFRWLPKKNLVRCSMVCKRFRRLAYDESLWIRCDLSHKTLPGNCLPHVIARGCRIVRLAQSALCDPIHTPDALMSVTCKLQYLDLSMASISASGLASLLSLCSHLKKLSLENCDLNDDCTKALAGNKDLEVINLAMCRGLTAQGLHTFLSGCRKIQTLNLAWTGMSKNCLDILSWQIPSRVERLNISGCKETLSNEHVIEILHRCEDILELDVSDCSDVNEVLVDFIVKYVMKIEHLALSRCYSLDVTCLPSLASVESLMFLDVFGLMMEAQVNDLKSKLVNMCVNQFIFSSVARPTVGLRRTSIWGLRVRD